MFFFFVWSSSNRNNAKFATFSLPMTENCFWMSYEDNLGVIWKLRLWSFQKCIKQEKLFLQFYSPFVLQGHISVELSGITRGTTTSLAETLPPSRPPNEIILCTEVYGELPFWVPVSPPTHPWAPLLAAPSFWKVWLCPWWNWSASFHGFPAMALNLPFTTI